MKLSKKTIKILKNYAQINQSIWLSENDEQLKTISINKNIMSVADIEEKIPCDFGIYDVNEFLSALSLFKDPDIEFSEKFLTISENSSEIIFYGCDKELVVSTSGKVNFPDEDVNVDISEKLLENIVKAAQILSAPDIIIYSKDDKVRIGVGDVNNTSVNTWSKELCDNTFNSTFKFVMKFDNLKILPGDYTVKISSKGITEWKTNDDEMVYYITLDISSEYEEASNEE